MFNRKIVCFRPFSPVENVSPVAEDLVPTAEIDESVGEFDLPEYPSREGKSILMI